jgi:hypothetical protein
MNMTRQLNDQYLPPPRRHGAKLLAPALALMCFAAQCPAQGTMTVGFEGQTSNGQYSESGMLFWNAYGPEHLTLLQSGWSGYPDNGSQYLGSGGVDLLTFRFDTVPTTYFNLVSLDLAEGIYAGPSTLQIIGYPAMSPPVTNTITTDGIMDGPGGQPDFETFYFGTDFQHVNRIQITTDRWCLDNVVISGIPEPSARGLLLLGAACAFGRSWIRRRRP